MVRICGALNAKCLTYLIWISFMYVFFPRIFVNMVEFLSSFSNNSPDVKKLVHLTTPSQLEERIKQSNGIGTVFI